MKTLAADVTILGAGTAGLNARRAAEMAGAFALLVDPGPLGTTCARVGCMPSKLLIAAAEAAWHAREAHVFGVDVTAVVNGPRVLQRVQRERDRFVGFVLESTDRLEEEGRLLRGRGRLVDPETVAVTAVDGSPMASIRTRTLVVATGSRPVVPPPYRGLDDISLDNESVFELPDLPDSVLVVGTGVIGLELGQALHRLGVRVMIVGIGGLIGPLADPTLRRAAIEVFQREIDLHPDIRLHKVERVEAGVRIRFADPDGSEHDASFCRMLMATGRVPNVQGIGLEHMGIDLSLRSRLGPGGAPRYDPSTMQVGDTKVFLAGDVTGDRPVLHEASDEGHISGRNAALWPDLVAAPRTVPLGVVFSDPQIAIVGAPWAEMSCERNRVGEVDYGNQGRARVMNQNRGLVRIYGEAGTGLLLGAEMVGPRVEHTAHLLAWAVQQRLTVTEALAMPFYHPVVEEGIRTALRDLQANLKQGRPAGETCEEFGPGA